METAVFDPEGPGLMTEIRCEPTHDGSYIHKLWEANSNKKIVEWQGNFLNTEDDSYELEGENEEQDGRLVEAMIVVAVPSGVGEAEVSLTVRQGDEVLAVNRQVIPPGTPGGFADLFIKLEALK